MFALQIVFPETKPRVKLTENKEIT
jgi:hypothetical protein